jgi:DNA-binding response OmpR family regulator
MALPRDFHSEGRCPLFESLRIREIEMAKRPTLIVAEPEPAEALSVRKLVLETAKFNVLTAHSTREAIDIFQAFPNASALIAVDGHKIDCELLTKTVKETIPKIPVLVLSGNGGFRVAHADYHISSHEPEELLSVVRELLGDPRTYAP